MTDKAYELVSKLFLNYNFNGTKWETDMAMDSYYNFIKQYETETGKEYDYDRMYRLIEREYSKKIIPDKHLIRQFQKRAINHHYDTSKDGSEIVYICYNVINNELKFRHIRNYTICNNENTTTLDSQVAYDLRQRYDEVVIRLFPKGSTLMGNCKRGYTLYYPPDDNGNMKSEVLVSEEQIS